MAEQRRVAEVSRSGLVRGHVELGEEVGARLVEGGREQRDADVARRPLELDVRVAVELERLAVLAVGRRRSEFSWSYGASYAARV